MIQIVIVASLVLTCMSELMFVHFSFGTVPIWSARVKSMLGTNEYLIAYILIIRIIMIELSSRVRIPDLKQ